MSKRIYTVADAILDVLKAHGITHIFGYPGGAILPFYDALPYHKDIKHILARHEQGAGFMAQGWARSTKRIGVCCTTSGPGGANAVTAVADAMLDSIPMLFITGQVPLNMIGNDMFQEIDMTGVTLNITKHNYLVDDPEKIVYIVTEAIKIATSGRPGPVHIDVPKDIMASEHPQTFDIPQIHLAESDPSMKAYHSVDTQVIQEVINALNEAKKPVLLVGHGVKLSGAEKHLNEFINILGIPTVNTVLAKGVVKHDNKHHLGMLGMHGFYHANLAMHNADLIINIGSRFDDRIVGRYDLFAQHAKIIHVDIDKSELNKVVHADIPIHSDALQFIEQMLAHPALKKLRIDEWRNEIKKNRQENPYEKTTDIFSMRNCLTALSEIVAKDPDKYIVVTDVGQHQMWSALSCLVSLSVNWLTSGGSGTMGFALPAAIGAAFANPHKTVICISGDGGIQMNIQELGVLAEHELNVKNLILNNNFLGMVRQWQELFYEHNYSSVAITSPDFVKLSEAYDIKGFRVTNRKEMQKVHKEIFAITAPCTVEYTVEKEDNVFPMVPGGKHLGETITKKS